MEGTKSQNYLVTVIWSSVIIMIYQGISNSNLGIITEFTHQNGNNWAGPLCTALLFLGSGTGCLYNKYIGKFKFKYCFFVGSFGYIIFISIGLVFMKLGFNVTTQVLIFLLSYVAGILCSVYYNTQFNYINVLSKIDDKEILYFGINMAFSQCSNIFSNILSSLLIKPLGQFMTVLVLDIIIIADSFVFLLFREPSIQYNVLFDNKLSKDSQISESAPQNNNAPLIEPKIEESTKRYPPKSIFVSFVFSGIIISFIYCLISIMIYQAFEDDMDETQLNHLTFILFIFEGVGQFIGGLIMIYLSTKKIDQYKILMLVNTLFILFVGIIYVGYELKNYYIMGIGIVAVGICDCSYFILSLTIAGNWQEKGITSFNLGQSLTVSFTVIFMIFVPVFVSICWILLFYFISIIGLYLYIKRQPDSVQVS